MKIASILLLTITLNAFLASASEIIMPTSLVSSYSYEAEEGASRSFQLFYQAREQRADGTVEKKLSVAGVRKATIYETHMLVTDEEDHPIELIPFKRLISVKFITKEELEAKVLELKEK